MCLVQVDEATRSTRDVHGVGRRSRRIHRRAGLVHRAPTSRASRGYLSPLRVAARGEVWWPLRGRRGWRSMGAPSRETRTSIGFDPAAPGSPECPARDDPPEVGRHRRHRESSCWFAFGVLQPPPASTKSDRASDGLTSGVTPNQMFQIGLDRLQVVLANMSGILALSTSRK
jgi:hypothetical protein